MAADIGIAPWDFWRLTPAEFYQQIESHNKREENELKKLAWQTVIIVNHWRKESDLLTVDDLLPKKKEPKREMTDEEMAQNALAWAIALGAEDRREVH